MAEKTVCTAALAELLTTRQAAELLQVRPATLEQWRWRGVCGPRYVAVGRSIRYRRSDIDAYLESRTFNSTTEAQAA